MKAIVNKSDVQRAFKNLDLLEKEIAHFGGIAAKKAAGEYASLVRSGIGTQATPMFVKTPWKLLSEIWKKAKTAYEDKFWIETGGIYRNVKTKVISQLEYFAGLIKADDPEAFERAMRNEYGFGLGPERPLFRPAIDFFTKKAGDYRQIKKNTMIWKEFKSVVVKAIRKVYGR